MYDIVLGKKLFEGKIGSQVVCNACQNVISKEDDHVIGQVHLSLAIEPANSNPPSVGVLLQMYFQDEKLRDLSNCEACKMQTCKVDNKWLSVVPQSWVMHLKIFNNEMCKQTDAVGAVNVLV